MYTRIINSYSYFFEWLAFFVISFLGFGTSFYWIKIALNELTALEVVAYRITIGAILLWIFVPLFKVKFITDIKKIGMLCFAGIIGTSCPFILITWSEKFISSGLAGILSSLNPLFTVILSAIFISTNELNRKNVLGVGLGLIGAILISSEHIQLETFITTNLIPQLAVILAAFCYAILSVYVKINFSKDHPLVLSSLSITFAALFLWIIIFITQDNINIPQQTETIIGITWMGGVSTALAQILLYYLIKKWSPTGVSLITYFMPLVAVSLGIIFLDEHLTTYTIIGGSIILFSIFLANQKVNRQSSI